MFVAGEERFVNVSDDHSTCLLVDVLVPWRGEEIQVEMLELRV